MPEEDYDIVRAKDDFPANLEFSLKKKKKYFQSWALERRDALAIYHNLIKRVTPITFPYSVP